jgi:hypothetical protein
VTEVLAGVKVGKRFDSWGIFAKARPGVVSFSEGEFNILRVPASVFDAIDSNGIGLQASRLILAEW